MTAAPSSQPSSGPSRVPVREEDIQRQMSSEIVQQALAMGIEASRIKMAVRKRLQDTNGHMFKSCNELVDAAFRVHREQEDRHEVETNESPAAFNRSPSFQPPPELPRSQSMDEQAMEGKRRCTESFSRFSKWHPLSSGSHGHRRDHRRI